MNPREYAPHALAGAVVALWLRPSYPAALVVLGALALVGYRYREQDAGMEDLRTRALKLEEATREIPALRETLSRIKNRMAA